MKTALPWIVWLIGSLAATVWLGIALPTEDSANQASSVFLPGETTHGHYQIEVKCSICHDADGTVNEQSCLDCHADDLKAARDTHPASKFNDPTKAVLLEKVNARSCLTCHREHVPAQTHSMGVTLPMDYCFHCHEDIASDRPSHVGLAFDSCATSGCHNYHDNTALYENFLVKHADQPDHLDVQVVPLRAIQQWMLDGTMPKEKALTPTDEDAPDDVEVSDPLLIDWSETAHAQLGVNCSSCHMPENDGNQSVWSDSVDSLACERCHRSEVEGFLDGLHGMRIAAGLSPMSLTLARLAMSSHSGHRTLSCNSCHPAHRYDTQTAAVDACLGCHADQHSLSYKESSHYELWRLEITGQAEAGSGVSCATCHLPRLQDGEVQVQHNQSWNLAPNEKMIRSVCQNCHGLKFSIDALADSTLKDSCYDRPPSLHIDSVDMAVEWFEQRSNSEKE